MGGDRQIGNPETFCFGPEMENKTGGRPNRSNNQRMTDVDPSGVRFDNGHIRYSKFDCWLVANRFDGNSTRGRPNVPSR